MTAWIRSNICKEPTIRRLLPSLVKITWPRVCWGRRGTGLWCRRQGGRTLGTSISLSSNLRRIILGDPGADSGGEGKSKRAEKYGTKKSKERREKIIYRLLSMNKIMKGIDRNRQ